MGHPAKNEWPAGQEHSEWVNAMNFIVDNVLQQIAGPAISTTLVETMWSEIEKDLEATDEQVKSITNNQIIG